MVQITFQSSKPIDDDLFACTADTSVLQHAACPLGDVFRKAVMQHNIVIHPQQC